MALSVYLAGPINGCDDSQVLAWREVAKRDLKRSLAVIDPADRDFRGVESENVKSIVEGDKADIVDCDFLLAYCWQPSYGTAMEILYAHGLRRKFPQGTRHIFVVVPNEPTSPWIEYHSDEIFRSLDDAIATLNELAP